MDEEYQIFTLDKIPKGSRLEKYLKKLSEVRSKQEIIPFSKNIIQECFKFICWNEDIPPLPIIYTRLMSKNQFKKELEREEKTSISREAVKKPELTKAFVVDNKLSKTIYIEFGSLIELLKFSPMSFIIELIDAYIHEVVHLAFPEKSEQETYNLGCVFLEHFLGIKVPEEKKSYNASDYYESRN